MCVQVCLCVCVCVSVFVCLCLCVCLHVRVEGEGIVVSKLERGSAVLFSFDNMKIWGARASFVNLGYII